MFAVLFHIFAFIAIGGALAVVLNRNAVHSAMCFLFSLLGVAGVFALLDSGLLAVLLVFVYAGAVVALFLFIIMLLDMKTDQRRAFTPASVVATLVTGGLLVIGLVSFARAVGAIDSPARESVVPLGADLKLYAEYLFTTYLLPVQVVGFLLLIAMLGVIVLSKRFEGVEDIK